MKMLKFRLSPLIIPIAHKKLNGKWFDFVELFKLGVKVSRKRIPHRRFREFRESETNSMPSQVE